MTALQFAIGALNDVVDAPADAGRVPPKPIPAGLLSARTGLLIATLAAVVGLAFAVPSGPALVVMGGVVLAIGAVYDLVAKGTPWSWLPFSVGIPILPVFGWYGAAGTLPGFFVVLVPMAILAGAGLAIANARVDVEDDTRAGLASVATALGPGRAWWINAALMAAASGLGIAFVGRAGWAPLTVAAIVIGTALVSLGLSAGRGRTVAARRRGWEAQAIGAAIAAVGWISGMLPGV